MKVNMPAAPKFSLTLPPQAFVIIDELILNWTRVTIIKYAPKYIKLLDLYSRYFSSFSIVSSLRAGFIATAYNIVVNMNASVLK
jgi:hypothetical protein